MQHPGEIEVAFRQWWQLLLTDKGSASIMPLGRRIAEAAKADDDVFDALLDSLVRADQTGDLMRAEPEPVTRRLRYLRWLVDAIGLEPVVIDIDERLAEVARATGRFAEAADCYRSARNLLRTAAGDEPIEQQLSALDIAVASCLYEVALITMNEGRTTAAADLFVAASAEYRSAVAHRAGPPDRTDSSSPEAQAAYCLHYAATALVDAGQFSTAYDLFEQAVTEFALIGLHLDAAFVHLSWGNAAVKAPDVVIAKTHLEIALPTMLEAKSPGAALCLALLAAIAVFESAIADAVQLSRLMSSPRWTALPVDLRADVAAIGSAVHAIAAVRAGDDAGAREHAAAARRGFVAAGEPVKAAAVAFAFVDVTLREGRPDLAREQVEAAREVLRSAPVEPNRDLGLDVYAIMAEAQIDTAVGDHSGARHRLERALHNLHGRTSASNLLAAQIAVTIGRSLFDDGLSAAAIDILVPAVLALDAYRFTLRSAGQRSMWSGALADGLATAYRAAAEQGDARLLAELIESAHGNAMPMTTVTASDSAAAALFRESTGSPAAAHRDDDPVVGSERAAIAGAWALGDLEQRVTLAVPPQIQMPWGSIALFAFAGKASQYFSPIRSSVVARLRLAPDVEPITGTNRPAE